MLALALFGLGLLPTMSLQAGGMQHGVEPVCVRQGDLPPGFAAWNGPAGTPGIGHPFVITAHDPRTMQWTHAYPSARAGGAAVVGVDVMRAGTYRVAINEGALIDIYRDRRLRSSVGHQHGPMCSGIRKLVDFRLKRGRYWLSLAGIEGETVRTMIVRVR